MIDKNEYHLKYEKADELSAYLNKRIFLKTELDIVYSDIVNWEREGLLNIGGESDKGDWKRLNCIEYVWLSIVHNLRLFGFTYAEIFEIKSFLFKGLTVREIIDAAAVADHKRDIIDSLSNGSQLEITEADYNTVVTTFLETLIQSEIINNTPISFLISKDRPGLVLPISKEVLDDYMYVNSLEILDVLFEDNMCAISLTKMIEKFFVKDPERQKQNAFTSILNENEKKLLKIVRKQPKTIKKLTVIINDGEMERIEITSLKKVQIESRLLEHIKKGNYQKIIIDTVDGNIVNFENTEKIKL